MSEREEFVRLASAEDANMAALCRRFGISRQSGYSRLNRFENEGKDGLKDRSRRPKSSPAQTPREIEEKIVRLREQHPAWGPRKIRARLGVMNPQLRLPSASTVGSILRRCGLIDPEEAAKHTAWHRFEHDRPNALWQMDFKGHFDTDTNRCHPLTVLDDHSRYSMALKACANESGSTVQAALIDVFRRYGLPERMTMDNGSPWGTGAELGQTALTVWLMRLSVRVGHSRPYHPQTQGKDERFHLTLINEVRRYERFRDLERAQQRFDTWRNVYNFERPHEALGLTVPASRYQPSRRSYPEVLPAIEYDTHEIVRAVGKQGQIRYNGGTFYIGKALRGLPVALRSTDEEVVLNVYFCGQRIRQIDVRLDSVE
jgi:transposase InsO family protein